MRIVARWETKGRDWLDLQEDHGIYGYTGNGCGGIFGPLADDEAAIAAMEMEWGPGGAGPVTVLRTDRASLRRVS